MEIVLNVAQGFKPNKDDVVVYDGAKWKVVNFNVLFNEQNKVINEYIKKFEELEKNYRDLQKKFNAVLDIVKEQVE